MALLLLLATQVGVCAGSMMEETRSTFYLPRWARGGELFRLLQKQQYPNLKVHKYTINILAISVDGTRHNLFQHFADLLIIGESIMSSEHNENVGKIMEKWQ